MKRATKKPEPLDAPLMDIQHMLEKAAPHRLEPEVVWSFGTARAAGRPVKSACAFALKEWDL